MIEFIEQLPTELLCTHMISYLELRDLVKLESATSKHSSNQLVILFLPRCSPIDYSSIRGNCKLKSWLVDKKVRIESWPLSLPEDIVCSENYTSVNSFDLYISGMSSSNIIKHLQSISIGTRIRTLRPNLRMTVDLMEQLVSYMPNVRKLVCHYTGTDSKVESYNWLTNKILSTWKLEEFFMSHVSSVTITRMTPYLQDVTVMDLSASVMDDAAVTAIAQHCPKLKTLKLWKGTYTVSSIIELSEQALPLEWLNLPYIPTIPDADTARRCGPALSRIRNSFTSEITKHNNIDTAIHCTPYLTGIQYLTLDSSDDPGLLPLLAQHCHSIECIHLDSYDLSLPDVLALCQANASLEYIQSSVHLPPLTDDMLLALEQSCPRLKFNGLSYEAS